MTELKLEVGKTYLDRNGCQVPVENNTLNRSFPFRSGGRTYTIDGRFFDRIDNHSNYDLISEYTPPAQPAARTPLVHAEQRHDHANEWDIEFLNASSKWEVAPLKPNEVIYLPIWCDGTLCLYAYRGVDGIELKSNSPALRIEWNPNDQTLVSAEVVTL